MNRLHHDLYFVRQRNEEVMREVQKHRLEKRLRASRKAGEGVFQEGKGLLRLRYAALIVVVAVLLTSIAFSSRAFASHEHYLLTPSLVLPFSEFLQA
jgi:hypothetical protein